MAKKKKKYIFEHLKMAQARVLINHGTDHEGKPKQKQIFFTGGDDRREEGGRTMGIFSTTDYELAKSLKNSGGFGSEFTFLRKKEAVLTPELKAAQDEIASLKAKLEQANKEAEEVGGEDDFPDEEEDDVDQPDLEDEEDEEEIPAQDEVEVVDEKEEEVGDDGLTGDDANLQDVEVAEDVKNVSQAKEYLKANHGAAAKDVSTKAGIRSFLKTNNLTIEFPNFDLEG